MLVKLVDAYSKLESNIKIWIKPHPANSIDLARITGLAAESKGAKSMELLPQVILFWPLSVPLLLLMLFVLDCR